MTLSSSVFCIFNLLINLDVNVSSYMFACDSDISIIMITEFFHTEDAFDKKAYTSLIVFTGKFCHFI